MLGDGHRGGTAQTGIAFMSERIFYAIEAGFAAKPVVPVKRNPETRLEVVTQMAFQRSNWVLQLSVSSGRKTITRKKIMIGSKKPDTAITVDHPLSPALGIPQLRFKGPPVRSPID